MKKIMFLCALFCASMTMFAAEGDAVATLDFSTKEAKHSAYNDSWAYGDWTVTYGANNNGGWTFVKLGGKSATLATANPCYLTYDKRVTVPVKQVQVFMNAGTLTKGSINSWGVRVYSDETMTTEIDYVVGGTITAKTAATYNVDGEWPANSYYKVEFDLANSTTTNGIVWIDKVVIVEDAGAVDVPATEVTLNQTSAEIEAYKSLQLTATLTPSNATSEIVWSSNVESIATVSATGLVTAHSVGEAVITAQAGEKIATCTVTVKEATVLTAAQAAEIAIAVSGNNVLAENGKYVVEAYVVASEPISYDATLITLELADEKGASSVLQAYKATGDVTATKDAKVRVVGNLTKYNGKAQFAQGAVVTVLESGAVAEDKGLVTVAAFLEAKDDFNIYTLKGTVSDIVTYEDGTYNKYGNFNLTDETGTIFIYGILTADNVEKKFQEMGIDNGDVVTLKGSYSVNEGTPRIEKAVYVTHVDVVSGLENVEATNRIFAIDGKINAPKDARIFNLIGMDVTHMNGQLSNGIFLVKTGKNVTKVLVKK